MEQLKHPRPVVSILVTLVAVLIGFQLVGPMIGLVLSIPFYEGNIFEMTEGMKNPTSQPEMRNVLFIMQGSGTLFGLIIIPALLLQKQKRPLPALFRQRVYLLPVLIVALLVITFMIVNSIFIEWNQNIEFPRALEGFEKWAKSTEQQLARLTEFLTKFDSVGQLILAMVVIAILPAIGEEIVFRGMIQNDFHRATGNIHISIWVSAILFSAIHLQFYGFVPRVLLGALFGYLYYWSGDLVMAIVAHFVNNGFTVLAMYFYQRGAIDVDIEKTESAPPSAVIVSVILTIALLVIFKKFYQNRTSIS
jgi:uncharacterized protein